MRLIDKRGKGRLPRTSGEKELLMSATPAQQTRKSIDCREYPSEKGCTLKLSGTEDEVLEAAVQHAIAVHGHENTPEFREQLRGMLKDE
jgi:hypothetical protein